MGKGLKDMEGDNFGKGVSYFAVTQENSIKNPGKIAWIGFILYGLFAVCQHDLKRVS